MTSTQIKRETEFRTTDDRVSQIIRLTVHTGLLTATLALADVIVFVALPVCLLLEQVTLGNTSAPSKQP